MGSLKNINCKQKVKIPDKFNLSRIGAVANLNMIMRKKGNNSINIEKYSFPRSLNMNFSFLFPEISYLMMADDKNKQRYTSIIVKSVKKIFREHSASFIINSSNKFRF